MTASPNIKTPAMEVPLSRQPGAQAEGERLKKYFTRVCLSQVSVSECVWSVGATASCALCTVTLLWS